MPTKFKNQRIGTYFLDKIIEWVKYWPHAEVYKITLLRDQALNPKLKELRNHFYEKFNIQFTYSDNEKLAGISNPVVAADLKNVDNWKQNIKEIDSFDFMQSLMTQNNTLKFDLKVRTEACAALASEINYARNHPIRFMIRAMGLW